MSDISDSFLVPGKVAMVTGAGSGIGQEIAIVLAQAGAKVIATDVNEMGLTETVAHAQKAGTYLTTRVLDVSDPVAVTATVEATVSEFGSLDILVNSAGIMKMNNVLDVSPEELHRVLSINLYGTFYACQAAGRVMKSGGRIINIASGIVDSAAPGRVTYAISKGGMVLLSRTFALELGPSGITVNTIAPGWVETGITRQHWTSADGSVDETGRQAYIDHMAASSPLGVVGTPRDIALTTLQLASVAGAWITGQVVRVNGGTMLQ